MDDRINAQAAEAVKKTASNTRKMAMISRQAFDTFCLSVFVIDVATDIIYEVALLCRLQHIRSLSVTDVYSRGGVAIDKA
jgi:hypothetical protein